MEALGMIVFIAFAFMFAKNAGWSNKAAAANVATLGTATMVKAVASAKNAPNKRVF